MSALDKARDKRKGGAKPTSTPTASKTATPKTVPKFSVGERVSPTDRENVGTISEELPGDYYKVHFIAEYGKEAEVTFHATHLRPWPLPRDGGSPVGGSVVVPTYRPFPVHCLPPAVKEFVASVAASVGCDPCFAALPALALVGAAVGGALVARPKRGWNEVPILWAVVVGDSGTAKSPAADPVSAVAHCIEDALEDEYEQAVRKFVEDVAEYREAMNSREADDTRDPPARPVPPVREYFTADDVTIERLIENLRTSPRGILMLQDELANWFGSFSRYKGKGGGSDAAKWLGMFDGRSVSYQRKTANPGSPRDVRVERPWTTWRLRVSHVRWRPMARRYRFRTRRTTAISVKRRWRSCREWDSIRTSRRAVRSTTKTRWRPRSECCRWPRA